MDHAIILALITIGVPSFLAAVATPIVVAVVQSKNKRLEAKIAAEERAAEKKAEWERADLLEARATERAAMVAKRAEETSQLLVGATINVRDLATAINGKVDDVHALVNSSYTAALQAALEAVQAKLVVLLDSVAFKREHKLEVAPEISTDIAATRTKMEELSAAIAERMRLDALSKEAKAKELLVGAQKGATSITRDQPLPVADNRTATATERTATASERVAAAAERSADATTSKS